MIEKDHDVSRDLLAAPPRVINIGLEIFAANLAARTPRLRMCAGALRQAEILTLPAFSKSSKADEVPEKASL